MVTRENPAMEARLSRASVDYVRCAAQKPLPNIANQGRLLSVLPDLP